MGFPHADLSDPRPGRDPRESRKSRPHIEPRDANVADGVLALCPGWIGEAKLQLWMNWVYIIY